MEPKHVRGRMGGIRHYDEESIKVKNGKITTAHQRDSVSVDNLETKQGEGGVAEVYRMK